jgi:hypothetical protein
MPDCFYCGELADGLDHTVPIAYTSRNGTRTRTRKPGEIDNGHSRVPSCQECNSLLGSQLFPTLQERAAYLARKLRARYRSDLFGPEWTAEELTEIGPSLRAQIERKIAESARIKRRVAVCQRIARL